MQTVDALEHCLLKLEWDRLIELGPTQDSDPFEEFMAIRMHLLGIVCPDATTLKNASAIIQAVMSDAKATTLDTRLYHRAVQKKLKTLDKASPWAFEYIRNYPRSPFELPIEVLRHASGDDRPIKMPDSIDANRFKLLVADTRYNKPRLEQTQPSVELVPHQGDSLSPTAQLPNMMNAGPFAALMSSPPIRPAV